MRLGLFWIFSLITSFSSNLYSQVVTDWVFPVDSLGRDYPIDISSILDAAKRESNKVFIVGYNRDNGASDYNLLDYTTRQKNIGNYVPGKVKLCFYNNSNKRNPEEGNDVWFRYGHAIENRNMKGVKSFYILITSNLEFNSSNLFSDLKLRKLDIQFADVRIYMSEGIETQEQFYWNLRQNLLFFSNYNFVPNTIEKPEPLKESMAKTYLDIQDSKGIKSNGAQSGIIKASAGVSLILNSKQKHYGSFNVNLGLQQSNDSWSSGQLSNQIIQVDNPNENLDELLISSSNVTEDYNLSATSAIIGIDFMQYLGKSKVFFGLYFNLAKPIVYNLSFANTSGEFDYVGVSNSIQEPLTNIPELGLVSGVSYVGYNEELTGNLSAFYDYGAMLGCSIGDKAPLEINFSLGFTTTKKFELDHNNSAISSSYGNYNSLATINTSHVSVPGYLNFGIGLRKYLN